MQNYPNHFQSKWQSLLNLIGQQHKLPSVLLTQIKEDWLEIWLKGGIDDNHFVVGEKIELKNFYCKAVVKNQDNVHISNAATQQNWVEELHNKRGMLAYMGFPIYHPNGELMGTLCVLDNKENHFGAELERHLTELKELIEYDLDYLFKDIKKQQKLEQRILGKVTFDTTLEQTSKVHTRDRKNLNISELLDEENLKSLDTDTRSAFFSNKYTAFVVFEAILDASGEMADARYIEMNALNEQLIGRKGSELIGKTVLEVFPKTKQEWFNRLKPVVQFKETVNYEMWHDATGKYCLTIVLPLKGLNFGFVSYQLHDGFYINQKLKLNESRYRFLLNKMNSSFAIFDTIKGENSDIKDVRFLDINVRIEQYIGKTLKEVVGKKISEVFPGIDDSWFEQLAPALNHNRSVEFKKWFKPLDKYLAVKAFPFGGDTIALVVQDLTEKLALNEKVELSERRYRSVFTKMNSALAVFSVVNDKNEKLIDARFLDINSKIEKFTDFKLEDVIGKRILDVFPNFEKDWFDAIRPVVTEGENVEFEKWLRPLGLYLSVKAFPFGKDAFALIIKDKTQEIQLKQKISDTELKYKNLFSGMDAAFALYEPILDEHGKLVNARYVDINAKKKKYLGKTAEEVIGKTVMEVFPKTEPAWFELSEKVLRENKVYNFKLEHAEIGKYFSCSAFPLEERRIAIISYDLTENRQLKQELINSEKKYRSLFHDNNSVEMVMNAVDGSLTDVNEAAVQFYGYSREQLLSMNICDITTRDREETEELLNLITEGNAKYFNSQHRLANGALRDVELYSDRLKIEGKLLLHFIIHDVTESKKTVLENKKLSMAVEQNPASIMITDLQGNMEYVNPKKCELTCYSKEELIGENPRIFKSGKTSKAVYREMYQSLLNGEKWLGEFYNKKKDGSFYWEQAAIAPIKNEEEKIINFIKIGKDITDQKQLEFELNKAKLKAEESDRLKSAFLANLSHEVRTPLNGIMGFTSLLYDEEVELEQAKKNEYAKIIQSSSEQLLMIMDDIMDISKIEAGELNLNESFFPIKEILDEVNQFHALSVKQAGKDIGLNSDICCVAKIKADKERIRQVFDNLAKNAIKFTDKGTITFGSKCQKGSILFYVQDTGIGIAPEDQSLIFDRFRQADPGANRVYGGNGLGLTISKDIVELMGGEIWVESEVGKGSKFCFTVAVDGIYSQDNVLMESFKCQL